MRTGLAEILAAWRRAERLVAELPVESPDRARAASAAAELRSLYQRLTDEDPATHPSPRP
jgi:hypothetical protein